VASAPEYRRSADTTSRCLERARSVGAGRLQIADGFLNPAGVSGHLGLPAPSLESRLACRSTNER